MEIFMTNIGFSTTKNQLKVVLANVLHDPDYGRHRNTTAMPINLEVYIHPQHSRKHGSPTRTGVFTVPTASIGEQFLLEYGGRTPRKTVVLGATIRFQKSNKEPRSHVVEELRRMPYEDPRIQEENERHTNEVASHAVSLSAIQFGWECRDNVFSVEWEKQYPSERCELTFDEERREFRVKVYENEGDFLTAKTRIIAMRASQISWASAGVDKAMHPQAPVIFLFMWHAPMFETDIKPPTESLSTPFLNELMAALAPAILRQRWSAFDDDDSLVSVGSYVSASMRLVCRTERDLTNFRRLCGFANMALDDFLYPIERRGLFDEGIRSQYKVWLLLLPWPVAFQVEALTLARVVDLREMMRLRRTIERIMRIRGQSYTISFLRHFGTQAKVFHWNTEEGGAQSTSIDDLFTRCLQEYTPKVSKRRLRDPSAETFDCLHVTVTPTTIRLRGPYPERSNRVMRSYPENHDSFLRVNFADETDLQLRFDRDVDGRSFVKRRIGTVLEEGLDIAGRHFDFLAYSQSALKEHAVWFVKEFTDVNGQQVNADTIIQDIGIFDNLPNDPTLRYCPARYAARISQAFTATDSSISIDPDEVIVVDDIKDNMGKWAFTDGVGTISKALARDIWKVLRARRRGGGRAQDYPRAFQIRFRGSKGMLSVDYRERGRVVTLRPSMIKFEAPNATNLEIARAFNKPGPFYLNRPFIMILEALGVKYEVFEDLQNRAVKQAEKSVESLERSARLLETYGLGASYRLTSVMLSLHKLGLGPLKHDNFWARMMAFAIHHVLRELKHHARIPVPNAWNLVGVADIHGWLKEGEVFGCIVPNDGSGPIYLEGDVMVSRSPTIHPGDVQVVRGIGHPPPGSPFAKESLRNTLVFSTKGSRPLPSYLGGGDRDGDEYRVTMLEILMPKRTYSPANYDPAPRRLLGYPSTMDDVADFVTEYITSDCLGIIAITWLIIADQSSAGVFDEDCMLLAALHSDAVDYPKSGQPVPVKKIPRLKLKRKPDWNAPETSVSNSVKYYESQRAIGRLFREIKLPAVKTARTAQWAQRRRLEDQAALDDILEAFHRPVYYEPDNPSVDIAQRIGGFIALGINDDDLVAEIWETYIRYTFELGTICADYTLSYAKNAMLTEEEVVVGTIVAACTQPRRRKDNMSQMREQATTLVDGVRYDISGDEGSLPELSLRRAWVAFRLSELENDVFGAKSFGWIALGEIFEAIKQIEESEGYS